MKVRLMVGEEKYAEVMNELISKGIEVDDDAKFILSEQDVYINYLTVKDRESNERISISVNEIVFIETCGRDVESHADGKVFQAYDRLYQLCNLLDPGKFIRVSNSVIIAKDKVKRIKPSFSMKYLLTMTDNSNVDVTRSYYNIFRDVFDI